MDVHPYGGPGNIVIDNCPHCRLNWLDSGEFFRVVRAPGKDRRRARE
jgi:Zn-finger nucleic acid-binding protein